MDGKIEIDPMITHQLTLDEINHGFDLMHEGKSIRSVVVYRAAPMEVVSRNRCFDGVQMVCTHPSQVCGVDMTFGVYLPPQAEDGPVPVLWHLCGLTCTHENAMVKGGFQRHAAEHGIAVIFPDTSPRGDGVADDDAYDLGQGAGFYVNATRAPWTAHFRMYDYVLEELRGLVPDNLPNADVHGVTGHSMGGHGALTLALRNPDRFDSLSAFAPIANSTRPDWGRKQLSACLGDDESAWVCYGSIFCWRRMAGRMRS